MRLTEREVEIARRVVSGQKRAAIASDLGIHINTVDFHLRHLRRKLRVSSLVQVAVWFVVAYQKPESGRRLEKC